VDHGYDLIWISNLILVSSIRVHFDDLEWPEMRSTRAQFFYVDVYRLTQNNQIWTR